jgi:hypothetical protein
VKHRNPNDPQLPCQYLRFRRGEVMTNLSNILEFIGNNFVDYYEALAPSSDETPFPRS